MALNLKNKLAAGFGVGAVVVIGAVLACSLPTKVGLPGAPRSPATSGSTAVAHESQARIDGALEFIEVSAGHYVSGDNPKGFGDPHYTAIERDGWITPRLLERVRGAARNGKTIVALWEPSCQYAGNLPGCMAWAGPSQIAACWSQAMLDTWPMFLSECRSLGMEPMWYIGCAGAHTDTMVEDLAFIAGMGVRIVGLDAFSYLVETNEPEAERCINAIRADPRTKNLTLITEGWLPRTLTGAKRAFFLRHMVQLELARGGSDKLAANDSNWSAMDGLPLDQQIVRGCRGIVLMHGSNWQAGDLEANYRRAEAAGLYVCDYRAKPAGN